MRTKLTKHKKIRLLSFSWMIAVALSALAVIPASAATPAPQPSPPPGGIGLAPGHYDPANPITRSYFIPTLSPGATYTDQVVVSNTSDTSIDMFVYPVDGLTAVTSGAVYANKSDGTKKWGKWITVSVSTLTVPAHGNTKVAFTVNVPADATPGDHLAGIAFENSQPKKGSGSVAVTTILRSVMGVLIKVPGPGQFQLDIKDVQIKGYTSNGFASIVVYVGDKGNRLGKPKIDIKLDGPNGYHKELSRQLDTILPGDYIQFPFPWPDTLPPGDYTVTVTGTGPDMPTPVVFTKTVTVSSNLPGIPNCAKNPTAAGCPGVVIQQAASTGLPTWFWFIFAPLVLLLILVIGFLIFFLLRRRKREDEEEKKNKNNTIDTL